MCDFAKIKEFKYYFDNNSSNEKEKGKFPSDISLGRYILLKVNNLVNKCNVCHIPFYDHVYVFYQRNMFIKLSFKQLLSVDHKNKIEEE